MREGGRRGCGSGLGSILWLREVVSTRGGDKANKKEGTSRPPPPLVLRIGPFCRLTSLPSRCKKELLNGDGRFISPLMGLLHRMEIHKSDLRDIRNVASDAETSARSTSGG
jgi:hypothetical protein